MGLLISSASGSVPDYYKQKRAAERREGRTISNEEFERTFLHVPERSGLSGGGHERI